jgi:hypothetical protein
MHVKLIAKNTNNIDDNYKCRRIYIHVKLIDDINTICGYASSI